MLWGRDTAGGMNWKMVGDREIELWKEVLFG